MTSPDDTTVRIPDTRLLDFLLELEADASAGWFQGIAIFTVGHHGGGYNIAGAMPTFPTIAEIALAEDNAITSIVGKNSAIDIAAFPELDPHGPTATLSAIERVFGQMPPESNTDTRRFLHAVLEAVRAEGNAITGALAMVGRGKEGLVIRGHAGAIDQTMLLAQLALARTEVCSVALMQRQQTLERSQAIVVPR